MLARARSQGKRKRGQTNVARAHFYCRVGFYLFLAVFFVVLFAEVFAPDPAIQAMIEQNRGAVERLGNVDKITFVDDSLAKHAGARSTARFDVHVIYERKIDVAAERERLKKDLEKIEKEFANNQRQLSNDQFLAKAPEKVVEGLRRRAQELTLLRDKIKRQLDELNEPGPNS